MNSVENLCKKIIDDANAFVAEKQAAIDLECAKIIRTANETAADILAAGEVSAKQRHDAYSERSASAAQKVTRNALLLEKSKLLDGIFIDAQKALSALDGDMYVDFISNLFSKCGCTNACTVKLQKNRAAQKSALLARIKNATPVFDDSVDGGLLIQDGDITYDCRVSTLLSQFRAEHEPELQNMVFGDSQ